MARRQSCAAAYSRMSSERRAYKGSQMIRIRSPVVVRNAFRDSIIWGVRIVPGYRRK